MMHRHIVSANQGYGRAEPALLRIIFSLLLVLFGTACSQKSDPFVLLSNEQLMTSGLYCRAMEGIPPTFFEQPGSTTFHKGGFEARNRRLLSIWQQDGGYFLVVGHVDRQEASTGQGESLSRARADAVARAVENLGIPKEHIFAVGRGDAYRLVVQLPGITSEPGNRRVEIIPTHWGRACEEDYLIRQAITLSAQCRHDANPDAVTAARCETELRRMPAIHRHFFMGGGNSSR
jgi:hypothetical protein